MGIRAMAVNSQGSPVSGHSIAEAVLVFQRDRVVEMDQRVMADGLDCALVQRHRFIASIGLAEHGAQVQTRCGTTRIQMDGLTVSSFSSHRVRFLKRLTPAEPVD